MTGTTDTGTSIFELTCDSDNSYGYERLIEEIAERNEYIHECRMRMYSVLGAMVQKGRLLYWRVLKSINTIILQPTRSVFRRRLLLSSRHWQTNLNRGRWY